MDVVAEVFKWVVALLVAVLCLCVAALCLQETVKYILGGG